MSARVPGLEAVRGYKRPWLARDLLAAVAVGALFVPQGLAYARIAGVAPSAALWSGVVAMLAYAVFGPSRQLIVGPEAGTALLTAAAIAPLGLPAGSGDYAAAAAALALLMALLLLAGGIARAGALADLLSKPILVGYLNGAALLIIASQLPVVLGLKSTRHAFGPMLSEVAGQLGAIHPLTVGLSAATLATLLMLGRFKKTIPAAALAVVGMIVLSVVADLHAHGVALVGEFSSAPPHFGISAMRLSDVAKLLPGAFSLALVGFASTVLTSRAFADKNGYRTDANQEFVGLAVGNLAAGLLGGMPIAASESRTALSDANRGRTQLVSLAAAVIVVMVVLALGPLIASLPTSTLGVIVTAAAVSLMNPRELRALWRTRRSEGVLALTTLAGVLALGILRGILIAVALSLADLLRRAARPHDAVLGRARGTAGYYDVERRRGSETLEGLIIYRVDGPLFFANARFVREQARRLVSDAAEPVRTFILQAEAISDLDVTAAESLRRLRQDLAKRGTTLVIAEAHAPLRRALRRTGLVKEIGAENIFGTLGMAIRAHLDRSTALGFAPRWRPFDDRAQL